MIRKGIWRWLPASATTVGDGPDWVGGGSSVAWWPKPHNVDSSSICPCQMCHGEGDCDSNEEDCWSKSGQIVLYPYLLKYFNNQKVYFATMLSSTLTLGILSFSKLCLSIEQSPVNHELAEIMFSVGQVVYPVTTKCCGAPTWRVQSVWSSPT